MKKLKDDYESKIDLFIKKQKEEREASETSFKQMEAKLTQQMSEMET